MTQGLAGLLGANMGCHTRKSSLQLAMQLRCKLQGKLPRVTWPLTLICFAGELTGIESYKLIKINMF